MTQIHQREIMKHDAIKLQTSHLVWSNCSRYGPASSEQSAPSVPLFWECAFQFITFHGWKKKKSHYILADSVWIYSTGPKTNSTNPSPTQFSTSVSSLNAFQCSSVNMFHSSHVYFFYTRLQRWLMTWEEKTNCMRGDTQPSSHIWDPAGTETNFPKEPVSGF